MAKFDMNTADNYGGSGMGGFFSLKNDKDVATVRFMYNTIDDVEGYAVHEIDMDGKKRYINCLRAYNEPVGNCPLCAAGNKVIAKIFVLLYDEDEKEVKIWDRGKTFFSKMSSLCSRYNPLVGTVFELERNGKKGDTKTTYETFPIENDNTTLEDLPEIPEVLGTLILDKTYEDIEYYMAYGVFEDDGEGGKEEIPTRRTPSRRQTEQTSKGNPATRRRVTNTPSDKF